MKKTIFTLLMVLGFGLFGQASGTVKTTHVQIQDMVRSTINQEWVFIDKVPHNERPYVWQFDIAKNGTGVAVATDLVNGQRFTFTVQSVDYKDPDEGQMVFLESLEIATDEKCTIIVHKIDTNHIISVMMPVSGVALFFDNLPRINQNQR